MLKVTGSAMGSAMPGAVFAAAAAGDGETDTTAPLLRDELTLYGSPQQKPRCVEPEDGHLEQSVAALRSLTEPYTGWCLRSYNRIKPKVQSAAKLGNDTYEYLKNPPNDFYPRAGVIGLTGVLGLFLARGSRVKRLLYPAGLVAVSASLYYPERAAVTARSAGDAVYERAVQSYAALEKMVKPQSKAGEEGTDSEVKP